MVQAQPESVIPGSATTSKQSSTKCWKSSLCRTIGVSAVAFILGAAVACAVTFVVVTEHERSQLRGGVANNTSTPDVPAGVPAISASDPVKVRRFFIAAQDVDWDYAPFGSDLCMGQTFKGGHGEIFTEEGIGRVYKKTIYRGFTNANFTEELVAEPNLGILGPKLHAEVGDLIEVVFRNAASRAVGLEPTGLVQLGESTLVNVGETITVLWKVPESAAPPVESGTTSQAWLYRSRVDVIGDANSGLVGPIIVTSRGEANADGSPKDVDVEFVTVLSVFNENSSPLLEANLKAKSLTNPPTNMSAEDFEESNLMHAINGRIYCNLQGLAGKIGDRVRWHVASVGTEVDLHGAHWHGHTMLWNGHRVDTVSVLPMQSRTLDFVADNAGTWMFHCHINDHITAGMMGVYKIEGSSQQPVLGGVDRVYYVAAEDVDWDYAPTAKNRCNSPDGEAFGGDEKVFFEKSANRIGSVYKKVLYTEYTDATFTTRATRSSQWEHLAMTGPLFRAEVGDTLVVHFKNLAKHPISVHPHGMWYNKSSEGTPYADGTSGADKADDAVATGGVHTYHWLVPERSGPGPSDDTSVLWMYHSHTNEVKDTYAGAIGSFIITKKGYATSPTELRPKGLDREFVLFLSVLNEGDSLYTDDNIAAKLPGVTGAAALQEDEGFQESNLMHAINGRMYCNLDGISMAVGERVRFYFYALGTEVDLHTPSFESLTQRWEHRTVGSSLLQPGVHAVTDVKASAPGDFLIQCHVNDHMSAGMSARYQITGAAAQVPTSGVIRSYNIQAEQVSWDYTPMGYDGCTGHAFDAEQRVFVAEGLGSKYTKAVFREYQDATFNVRSTRMPQMGLLGPTIHAEVGDIIEVQFKNALNFAANLFLGGGLVRLDDCGDEIATGNSCKYRWAVPPTSGPGPADLSTVAYVYLSSVDRISHTHAGLVGALVVSRKNALRPDNTIVGVDVAMPLLFAIQNENESPFLSADLTSRTLSTPPAGMSEEDFEESNLMHSVNGFLYCNGQTVEVTTGQKVRLLLLALGSENDIHTPYFHGHVVEHRGAHQYASDLMPFNTMVVDVAVSECGAAEMSCAVHDHYAAGMRSRFVVSGCAN